TSTAKTIPGVQTTDQGAGLIAVGPAWDLLKKSATTDTYTVKAPVNTSLSGYLQTPGFGTGVYDREGGLTAGQSRTYSVVITRTSGPSYASLHTLTWKNNDGTFKVASPVVSLPLNTPVTVKVTSKPM